MCGPAGAHTHKNKNPQLDGSILVARTMSTTHTKNMPNLTVRITMFALLEEPAYSFLIFDVTRRGTLSKRALMVKGSLN